MSETSFDQDRDLLKNALLRALRIEADNPSPEPAVLEQVAQAFDRQNEPVPPEIPGRAELAGIFRDRPPLALVFFDTPGLQDYVFKVLGPIDIFGGSSQVADFTRHGQNGITPPLSYFSQLRHPPPADVTIYAGAGTGLLLVAAREASDTITTLEKILAKETAGDLHSRAEAIFFWPDELAALPGPAVDLFSDPDSGAAPRQCKPPSRYAAALAAVIGKHQRERSRRQTWPPTLGPDQQFERCPACGGRPTDPDSKRTRGDDSHLLCKPCHRRWRYGAEIRRDREEPRSFEELLAGLESPVGLAVIYADGANAGGLFSRIDTPARHRALSRTVETALEAAADAVRRKVGEIFPGSDDELHFQTKIQGGDDLVMVVPARGVLELAAELIAAFEQTIESASAGPAFARGPESLKKALSRFGLGVGIAVGDVHFPIQFLLDYARELMKSAKRLTRRQADGTPQARSALDFLVLRGGTPLAGSIADLRRKHQEKKDAPVLHCRPLRGGQDLDQFVKATRALRKVAPAQVQAIRRELPRGRELSLNLWRYQHARSAEWETWRKTLGVPLDQIDGKLWRRVGEKWVTDFLDQVDARDLVVNPEGEP
jgi:hypothetical protein